MLDIKVTRSFTSQSSYLAGIILTAGRGGRARFEDKVLPGDCGTAGSWIIVLELSSRKGICDFSAGAASSSVDPSSSRLDVSLRFPFPVAFEPDTGESVSVGR
jgi:hypothetical protein